MKSKIISISAISAGLIAIVLVIGAYFEVVDLSSLVISSIFVCMPLYYNSYKGSVLGYLAGGVISFMCSGFNIMSVVFPAYFAFFGIFPIIRCKMIEKNLRLWLRHAICLVWFIGVSFGMFFYYTQIMGLDFDGLPTLITNYVLYIIPVVAVIVYIIYDKFIAVSRFLMDKYLRKIVK